jgi:hypothetical protein
LLLKLISHLSFKDYEKVEQEIAFFLTTFYLSSFFKDSILAVKFCERQRDGFINEFSNYTNLMKVASENYRKLFKGLNTIYESWEIKTTLYSIDLRTLLENELKNISFILNECKETKFSLSSHIHMLCNRIFKSDQRFMEYLTYENVILYYRSLSKRK